MAGQINPRGFAPRAGVPGVADEDADAGGGRCRHPGLLQETGYPGETGALGASGGEVVEGGEGVGLAAAELGDQGQDRSGIFSAGGKSPQDHAGVVLQRPRETGAGKELGRIAVVLWRGPGEHLLEGDGELVRAEGAPFAHFFAKGYGFIPGI